MIDVTTHKPPLCSTQLDRDGGVTWLARAASFLEPQWACLPGHLFLTSAFSSGLSKHSNYFLEVISHTETQ